jgi:hypothetical protein
LQKITVLSPVPPTTAATSNPGPVIESLDNVTVGLRTEWIWPAYHVIADEWQQLLEAQGAKVIRWEAQDRAEAGVETVEKGLEEFVGNVDLAIVGLAN